MAAPSLVMHGRSGPDSTREDRAVPVGAAHKTRESRLRRAAGRQGLRLERSRQREQGVADDGRYFLIEGPAFTGRNSQSRYLLSNEFGATLDEIEVILYRRSQPGIASRTT